MASATTAGMGGAHLLPLDVQVPLTALEVFHDLQNIIEALHYLIEDGQTLRVKLTGVRAFRIGRTARSYCEHPHPLE